jgi:glutathione synthase/RimK-type ligase-like ATP-grasp enzyme
MGLLAIGKDQLGWWQGFKTAAEDRGMKHRLVDMERSDWLTSLEGCDLVLWRPNLDAPYCEEAKEKIYFLERVRNIRVIPNWNTFWHYDNKRAQAYLFQAYGIPTPRTFVSYSQEETLSAIPRLAFPLVSKSASGAGSSRVHLVRTPAAAHRECRTTFRRNVLHKGLDRMGIQVRLSPQARSGYVLWQEYIGGNQRDLRITVIGKKHVFAFWRMNRTNDFRASGSGKIAYGAEGVEEECKYCLDMCQQQDFDTMAFDVVYREKEFMILEMSYAFNAEAIHNAPGHYIVDSSGAFEYETGRTWPQELIFDYAAGIARSMT